jgi:coenzyme F420-reducing hydrogenase delta subunit
LFNQTNFKEKERQQKIKQTLKDLGIDSLWTIKK